MSKVIVWENLSGYVKLSFPYAERLAGESETTYLTRVRILIQNDPALSGFTHVASVEEASIPRKWPLMLPGAPDYEFGNGQREINPINYRECFVWNSGAQLVEVSPTLFRQEYLRVLQLETKRRLEKARSRVDELEDANQPIQAAQHRQYRQQLRNLPQQTQQSLNNITTVSGMAGYTPPWPTEPQ